MRVVAGLHGGVGLLPCALGVQALHKCTWVHGDMPLHTYNGGGVASCMLLTAGFT